MKKTYELNDCSKFNKRRYEDFNLYGCNLNTAYKEEVDDLKKYGRVN